MKIIKLIALIFGITFIPRIAFADLIIPFFDYGFRIFLLPIVIIIESLIVVLYANKYFDNAISAKKSFGIVTVANVATYILGYILTAISINSKSLETIGQISLIYILLFLASSLVEGIIFLIFIREDKIKVFLASLIANLASYIFLFCAFLYLSNIF